MSTKDEAKKIIDEIFSKVPDGAFSVSKTKTPTPCEIRAFLDRISIPLSFSEHHDVVKVKKWLEELSGSSEDGNCK